MLAGCKQNGFNGCRPGQGGTPQRRLTPFPAPNLSSEVMRLPRRVPYGFHSLWLSEEQLGSQATSAAGGMAVLQQAPSRRGGPQYAKVAQSAMRPVPQLIERELFGSQ